MDMVAFKALAAAIRPMIAQGTTRYVVTSSGPREGKSTIAANLARALASSGKYNVTLVDADLLRPTLHQNFGMQQRRGLTELMTELYHMNLARDPSALGLGDWIELLRAQSRTGTLKITSSEEEFSVAFAKGRIASLHAKNPNGAGRLGTLLVDSGKISAEQRDAALLLQKEGPRRIGEVLHGLGYVQPAELETALLTQVRSSLHRVVAMPTPKFSFVESHAAQSHGGQARTGPDSEEGSIDRFVSERFSDYLKCPFLSSHIPGYFSDTEIENLKLLTRGEAECDVTETAFQVLLNRLSKISDVVIIDSPPVAVTSPARPLALMAQAVLFVVKSEGYDLRIVQQARDHLVASGANVVGVVLNQVNVKNDPYVAYYYGSYRR